MFFQSSPTAARLCYTTIDEGRRLVDPQPAGEVMRVLIIEDDQDTADLIIRAFTKNHILVDHSADGGAGVDLALQGSYDVVIIDWMLPGRDGPAICRTLREAHLEAGLLLLTARTEVENRVIGLESGADDYLGKPFAMAELRARVLALGRRVSQKQRNAAELRAGDLVLDPGAHTARHGNQLLNLTPTEWKLLEFLIRHQGQVVSRQQILDYVWSYDTDVQLSLVDVYVSYLRRKLERPDAPDLIQTVRGMGYRLAPGPG